MSAEAIVYDLGRQGIRLQRDGEKLKVEARRSLLTPVLIERLRSRKEAILAVIDRRQLFARPRNSKIADIVELWPEEDIERFHERAAIREFDGGMSREATEQAAAEDVMQLAHPSKSESHLDGR